MSSFISAIYSGIPVTMIAMHTNL